MILLKKGVIVGTALDVDGTQYAAVHCPDCSGTDVEHIEIIDVRDREVVCSFYNSKHGTAKDQAAAFITAVNLRRTIAEQLGITTRSENAVQPETKKRH